MGTEGTKEPGTQPAAGLGRGDSIGRYLVLGLLGKGGMGEVYAAYDPELDRKVALKLLRPKASAGVDPSEGRARLLREAQAIARLSDPNVVVVFDVGMFRDQVFLAMEFVDGYTLTYWQNAEARSWREVVQTFVAAGRGLASAHKAGLVHRDFKPDNVMITRDGQVRVMDFGLARTIEPEGEKTPEGSGDPGAGRLERSGPKSGSRGAVPVAVSDTAPPGGVSPVFLQANADWTEADVATRDLSAVPASPRPSGSPPAFSAPLTVTGAMMGTPAYMAPEQIRGLPLDARSDQFSFCVALYEALYGERPFEGKDIHELTANVLAGRARPAPPKARVPGWLRRVVLRGLRVDRNERYPSMEALLATLAKDPARSRQRWALAGAVAGLIAVLSAGLVRAERDKLTRCLGAETKLAGVWELPMAKGELSPRKEAIRRAFMATGKRYAADSFELVRNALDRYVSEWNDMHRESCEATNLRGEQSAEVLDLRTSCLQDRFSEVRALTNVFGDATGDVVTKAVEAVQSIRPVEQCADIAALRAVVRPPADANVRRAVAEVRTQLADIKALTDAGGYKAAATGIEGVVKSARGTKYDPLVAEALLQLGQVQMNEGDAPAAERSLEEAVLVAEAARHDEVVVAAETELIYAVGYALERTMDAERWARHAGAVLRRLGPGHDVLAAWRANNLAAIREREGKFDEALAAVHEALALKTASLGEAHFDVGVSLSNAANYLLRLQRLDEAVAYSDKATQTITKALGAEHPILADCLVNAAEIMNAARAYSKAESFASRALAIWQPVLAADHPKVAYALTALGISLLHQARAEQAISPLRRALAIRVERDPAPLLVGETQFALAQALETNRQSESALAMARAAREKYGREATDARRIREIDAWIATRSPNQLSMR